MKPSKAPRMYWIAAALLTALWGASLLLWLPAKAEEPPPEYGCWRVYRGPGGAEVRVPVECPEQRVELQAQQAPPEGWWDDPDNPLWWL